MSKECLRVTLTTLMHFELPGDPDQIRAADKPRKRRSPHFDAWLIEPSAQLR